MSRKTPLLGKSGTQRAMALTVVAACLAATGCTALVQPVDAVPSDRVPPEFLARPQANKIPIDLARLRQEPPEEYLLDAGDTLGIAIDSILGKEGEPPPTHFPERGSDLPPAIGFPIPINEDGTISLPLVPPIPVKGLTLTQARDLIRKAYMEDQKILREDRIIVTLIRERRIRVTVVREDNPVVSDQQAIQFGGSQAISRRLDKSGRGFVVDLPAYKNDVMEALAQTGGLPGLNAKAEIKILRGKRSDFQARDRFVADFYRQYYQNPDPCGCPPPLPDDPSIVKIPLRLEPGQIPTFTQEDIILEEGDIVYVEGREAEVFYAGGLLRGGEYPLPRDYDLDVLGAIALAGGSIGAAQGGGGGFGQISPGVSGAPPGEVIILRKLPCGQQIAISVDLTDAINNPAARPLIQPGDTVLLRYRPVEEVLNFSIGTFFVYGIRELFN